MTKSYIAGHPRPQFVRPAWESLNGTWQFAFDDANRGEAEKWYHKFPSSRPIEVPFCYETKKSGIGDETFHPVVWYQRTIAPKQEAGKRVYLHFEGSDYLTKVWVNGQLAGQHTGGYTRFSFDVTDLLCDGESTVTVRAEDSFDRMQPRGKQRWIDENFGCWYVQTTGIWKSVWMEYIPETHLVKVKMTPNLKEQALVIEWSVCAKTYGPSLTLKADITYGDLFVNSVTVPVVDKRGKVQVSVSSTAVDDWGVREWRPEHPNLYDIQFEILLDGKTTDCVASYFGMREIRTEDGQVLLNGRPIYQKMILDQGYWGDSHLTPPDEAAIVEDIDKILAMGFNGARKHQKIEDGRYAYWCDVKGLLMWCEMPSTYVFGDDAVQAFTTQWMEIVDQHYNHPSIVTWTPFNESWGVPHIKTDIAQQSFTEGIYYLTKAFDPMRPVIVNDGWEHTVSDIITLHDYEELGEVLFNRYTEHKDDILEDGFHHNKDKSAFANGYIYQGQPVIISEYGGAAFTGGSTGSWGYGNTVETVEQFVNRIDDVTTAIKELPYVCGYCYTQVSDVQQEINGLMDTERNFKAGCDAIRQINDKIL